MVIGEEVKTARTAKGLTQDELAGLVGISRNYISDIERGQYTPSVKTLAALAATLDIDLNFLTKNVGNLRQP